MLHRFILNCIVLSLLVSCASYGPKGKYGGTIGIIPVKDNILNEWIIREVVSNGPASLAGLKVNDVILEINGKKTDDFSHRKFTKTIRGQAGSIVKLNIQRNADISYFTVKRAYVSHNSNLPDRPYIPKNMNDCFRILELNMGKKALTDLKNTNEKDIIEYHFKLGLWIRSKWGLWRYSRLAKYFIKKGINHPDDMSYVILKEFNKYLNNKPMDERFK